ncbi:MAG: mechanosensitive ion channel [Clostridia bacterium]|nr:mechanosensitive ion channel [Clostridia bacterium]
MEAMLNNIWQWLITSGLKLVLGVIFVLVAFKIINVVAKKLENAKLPKRIQVDNTLKIVGISVIKNVLKVVVVIIFITTMGVETSSIAAVFASIGLTIGLALEGSLSNIASFVIIITMRQFRIGDYINCAGVEGTVEKIRLFYTVLVTPQNQVISVPNSSISSSTCVNYSMKDTRRLDLTFSIAYENNFLKAKQIISECIERVGLALPEPEPFINVKAHNASSIDIVVRVWTKSSDYWTMNWSLMEMIKMEFDNNDISIPYQQVDIHMVDTKPKKINYAIKDFEIKHVEAGEINSKVEEGDDGILDDASELLEKEETTETTDIVVEDTAEAVEEKVEEPVEEEFVPVKQDVVVGKVVRTKGQQQVSGKIIDRKKQKELKRAEKEAKKLAKKQAKLEKSISNTDLEQ